VRLRWCQGWCQGAKCCVSRHLPAKEHLRGVNGRQTACRPPIEGALKGNDILLPQICQVPSYVSTVSCHCRPTSVRRQALLMEAATPLHPEGMWAACSIPQRPKQAHSAGLTNWVAPNVKVTHPSLAQIHGVFPLNPSERTDCVHDLKSFWAHRNRCVRCREVSGDTKGA
jgi:hypothetical protein